MSDIDVVLPCNFFELQNALLQVAHLDNDLQCFVPVHDKWDTGDKTFI